MAADLATMKARIQDELHRTDLTSQIANAINDAIRFYRSKNFEFTEGFNTLSTISGTRIYADTLGIGQLNSVVATVSQRIYPLEALNFPYYQQLYDNAALTGQPLAYAYYNDNLFIWPTPNGVYPLRITYTSRTAAPTSDSQVTVWTNQAEPLIRARAEMLVNRDYMKSAEGTAASANAEAQALEMLMDEATLLQDIGPLAGHW